MYRLVLPLLIMCLTLTACGKRGEEPIVEEPLPAHEQMESTVWNNIEFSGITPVSSFESGDGDLMIYPYYDSDKYVRVKLIEVSDNDLWTSATKDYLDSDNLIVTEDYSYVTHPDQITYGFVPIDDATAYYLKTDCPSSYMKKVCELLCNTNT